jgi:chemotaxis signal transduction protein
MKTPPLPLGPTGRRGETTILFTVAANTFAIAASAVEEIRGTEGLQPWASSEGEPGNQAHYRLQRAGNVYRVIDAGRCFFGSPARLLRVLVLRNRNAAVLVEEVRQMTEISALYALPQACSGRERQWYRGLALLSREDGEPEVVPVVSPDAFLPEAPGRHARTPISAPRSGHKNSSSYVLFPIGERRFALPAELVAEFVRPSRVHVFPHTTPLLQGVLVRRGRLAPVLDVSGLLTQTAIASARFYLVVRRAIGGTEEWTALPVTGECELVSAQPQPRSGLPSFATGLLSLRPPAGGSNEEIAVIDLQKLLGAAGAGVQA